MSQGEVTRADHLEWCKKRARELLDAGDPQEAIASMLSDLSKHAETSGIAEVMGGIALFEMMNPTVESARRFVEGFN